MWNKCLPSGALYQALLTPKMNLGKVLEQKVFKNHNSSPFNFLQVRAYLYILWYLYLFKIFWVAIFVSLNLVSVPIVWSLINSVTQLLGLSYWNDLLWFLTVTVECWKGPRSVSIPIEALLKRLSSVFFRVILFFSWLLLPLFCFCVDDYIFSFVVRFEIARF